MTVAVIGAGFMARCHLEAWERLDMARRPVSMICSPSDRGQHLANRYGAVWTNSLDDVLATESIEAVDICTPTYTHPEIVRHASAARKHALVEKPVGLNANALDELEALYKGRAPNQVLMAAHVVRFFPEYAQLATLAETGQLGDVKVLYATRLSAKPDWAPWILDEQYSGGVVLDFLVHDIDVANWILGTATRVRCRQLGPHAYALSIDYRGGKQAHITGGYVLPAGAGLSSSLRAIGTGGEALYDSTTGVATLNNGTNEWLEGDPPAPESADADPYALQLRHFTECVATGTEPAHGDFPSALRAARLALAARESVQRNQPVDLVV